MRRVVVWLAAAVAAVLVTASAVATTAGDQPRSADRAAAPSVERCPWIAPSRLAAVGPAALARQVTARMTLAEKAGYVVLRAEPGIENINTAVPSLCLPALTLSDGPDGLAHGLHGVVQLPAAISVAASFDPSLARVTGQLVGSEARAKGVDVVQGPELNLARVPESGRIFEAYGEDPYLAGRMGVADVEGIQSAGVMAEVKHFTAYNQETYRLRLDQIVPRRALVELYDAPFAAVFRATRVAAVMCSYGELDGTNSCSDPWLYRTLHTLGFRGFVRSDLNAVADDAAAFRAGIALVKPGSVGAIERLVRGGAIPPADLDRAVQSILTQMFAHGLITRPRQLRPAAETVTGSARAVALRAAEQGMVLLRNRGGVLPLVLGHTSVAVIGSAADGSWTATGRGSSQVRTPRATTVLSALRTMDGRRLVTYVPGAPGRPRLQLVTDHDTLTDSPPLGWGRFRYPADEGDADLRVEVARDVTSAVATATRPGRGRGWSSWHLVLHVHRSGLYDLSVRDDGDTWLSLDGRALISSPGIQARWTRSTTVPLRAGTRYSLTLRWFAVAGSRPPAIGLDDVTNAIGAAVAAARRARVAVVMVGDVQGEGSDRDGLALPGDADALITAVAHANPRTVVVLETGGAVLMPWLHQVAAVVEAWYPGQEAGPATAAVLTGQTDPSGHLPLTFPASGASSLATTAQYPGTNGVVHYREGLDIGYRWYQAHHVPVLFPFGWGLSYTTFALSRPTVHPAPAGGAVVRVRVADTGRRAGSAVVQAYVGYPPAAGEPPWQLRAFARVPLAAGQSRIVVLPLRPSAFRSYRHGRLVTLPGRYTIGLGQSSASLPLRLHLRETRHPSVPA